MNINILIKEGRDVGVKMIGLLDDFSSKWGLSRWKVSSDVKNLSLVRKDWRAFVDKYCIAIHGKSLFERIIKSSMNRMISGALSFPPDTKDALAGYEDLVSNLARIVHRVEIGKVDELSVDCIMDGNIGLGKMIDVLGTVNPSFCVNLILKLCNNVNCQFKDILVCDSGPACSLLEQANVVRALNKGKVDEKVAVALGELDDVVRMYQVEQDEIVEEKEELQSMLYFVLILLIAMAAGGFFTRGR